MVFTSVFIATVTAALKVCSTTGFTAVAVAFATFTVSLIFLTVFSTLLSMLFIECPVGS